MHGTAIRGTMPAMQRFEEIFPGIHLLKVPFGDVWTGVTLVRGAGNILIDSSQAQPEEFVLPALAEMGLGPQDIAWLLNTHVHGDHIGGHHALVATHGLKAAVLDTSADALRDPVSVAIRVRTRFPQNSPPPQTYLQGVEPAKVLAEGERLDGRLYAVRTPGHDDDCVCWIDPETKTAFTGDSIQANGTPAQGIGFYRDLAAYRRSLAHLREYDIENIVCGHDYDGIGSIVRGRENVLRALDYCEERVALYGRKIREYVAEGVPVEDEPVSLALRLIDEVGCGRPRSLFLALHTVSEHLKEMNP